ncbi:MAG: hypothetical protein E7457_00460 [Ruminococcaceae bacterium]|nr:hypothetical protein [Oscillospiraceae bacterium]
MKQMIREFNLELDRPTVDVALRRLEAELEASRHLKRPVIKLIHGYGSSGQGGRIRTACRKQLEQLRQQGKIHSWLPGERFSIFEEEARQAMARCPVLREDRDRERENRGITFVLF